MSQYNIYLNSHTIYTHIIDIQSPILNHLSTRLVVPLVSIKKMNNPITILNPIIRIKNEKYVALTQDIASVDKK